MICKNCGNEVEDYAVICSYCGALLNNQQQEQQEYQSEQEEQEQRRMVYCRNCGKKIDEKAYVCPHCGVLTGVTDETQRRQQQTEKKSNVFAIAGFILSFFVAIAGLVLSIIGCSKSKELNGEGKGLSIAGIIISAISMGLNVLSSVYTFFTIFKLI